MILGVGQFGLGTRLLQRRFEIRHLRLQHGHIETRQHLAAFDVIAGLDINRRHPARVAFDADGHVVAGIDGADDADGGRHGADRHLGHRHRGKFVLLGVAFFTPNACVNRTASNDGGDDGDHQPITHPQIAAAAA